MINDEKNDKTARTSYPRSAVHRSRVTLWFLRTRILLVVLVVGMLAYPSWYYWNFMQTRFRQDEPLLAVATNDTAADSDRPSENKPNVVSDAYEVPPNHPRRIVIDSIGVNGFIQSVGITKDNAVDVPNNVHVAGWYNQSVVPGEPGLSIIDGHVSGKYSDGIFYNLQKLSIGDTFQIEYGNRSTKRFAVIAKRQLPEAEAAAFLFAQDPSVEAQINLITCGGDFNARSEQYADRVIVAAKLVEP